MADGAGLTPAQLLDRARRAQRRATELARGLPAPNETVAEFCRAARRFAAHAEQGGLADAHRPALEELDRALIALEDVHDVAARKARRARARDAVAREAAAMTSVDAVLERLVAGRTGTPQLSRELADLLVERIAQLSASPAHVSPGAFGRVTATLRRKDLELPRQTIARLEPLVDARDDLLADPAVLGSLAATLMDYELIGAARRVVAQLVRVAPPGDRYVDSVVRRLATFERRR